MHDVSGNVQYTCNVCSSSFKCTFKTREQTVLQHPLNPTHFKKLRVMNSNKELKGKTTNAGDGAVLAAAREGALALRKDAATASTINQRAQDYTALLYAQRNQTMTAAENAMLLQCRLANDLLPEGQASVPVLLDMTKSVTNDTPKDELQVLEDALDFLTGSAFDKKKTARLRQVHAKLAKPATDDQKRAAKYIMKTVHKANATVSREVTNQHGPKQALMLDRTNLRGKKTNIRWLYCSCPCIRYSNMYSFAKYPTAVDPACADISILFCF